MQDKITKMEEELTPFGFSSSELDNQDQDAIDLGREPPPKNNNEDFRIWN